MLRAHTMPNVSHFLDVARLTESDSVAGQNSGIWNVWATTNFDGAASLSLTNMTADGTHGDYFGVLANGVGDPLKQEVPYIPTGLFPTVLTASGTFTGSIGILGTNQATMTSTGYTNNNTYDVRVFNLQGTTIIFSNSVSKGNAIIGTIAVNNDFLTLHPHEMLYGTGMTGSIIQ
jgi:hypothetical protein